MYTEDYGTYSPIRMGSETLKWWGDAGRVASWGDVYLGSE